MTVVAPTESKHLLIVDDDREIRDLASRFLQKHGYRITTAKDGRAMKAALTDWRIDLIVLDLMLPGEDGLMLCRDLRTRSKVPIIMLTAMGEEMDRIVGLEMGADDYMAKPFNPRELLARIKAVLRRTEQDAIAKTDSGVAVYSFAGWKLNVGRRQLKSPAAEIIELSAGEFDLLLSFVEHPQRVLSRDQLLDFTHGRMASPFDRSVDVQVSRLRRKIESNPKEPDLIKTVRSGGYVFATTVEQS